MSRRPIVYSNVPLALAFLPLAVCATLAIGVTIAAQGAHAQAGPTDTARADAPAAVPSGTASTTPTPAATTGGAATTRAPGGVGGTVATGALAPPPPMAPRNGFAPAGTNEAQMGSSGSWWNNGTSTSAYGSASTYAGTPAEYAPGTWMPGLGLMPGAVFGPNVAGASQTPIAVPSAVAVGRDGRPARARNVGEGEGEMAASASASPTSPPTSPPTPMASATNMPVPAQVFIVAPGFIPANASSATTSGAVASGATTTNTTATAPATNEERDVTPIDVTSAQLAAAPESYSGRKITLRGRVTKVDGNNFMVTSRKTDAATLVVAPELSDSPLRENVIVTGTLENRDGKRVLVAESVIQIER